MRTKNAKAITRKEHEHLGNVKSLPCSLCNQQGPSDAHHINQGQHFTTIALCKDCHVNYNGIHGTKAYWKIRKMSELDALNVTIERLLYGIE